MIKRARIRRALSAWAALLLGLAARSAPAALPPERTPALIQIGVEVVEVDENKSRKLGVDWLSSLHVEEKDVPSLLTMGTLTRSKVFADIQVLMEQGAADILANPKLVTRDGTTATFHAGGELPYAVAGSLGTVTIEFKPYGVNLKINPKLDGEGRIAMTLDAEVSGPDAQNSVTLGGNTVPGLRSRRVSSQLTLDPGTTLTMAGLIQNQKETSRKGVPGLMDIPVLGYLFSHRAIRNQRTSIVVFVTPTILEPLAAAKPTPSGLVPVPAAPASPAVPATLSPERLPHVAADPEDELPAWENPRG